MRLYIVTLMALVPFSVYAQFSKIEREHIYSASNTDIISATELTPQQTFDLDKLYLRMYGKTAPDFEERFVARLHDHLDMVIVQRSAIFGDRIANFYAKRKKRRFGNSNQQSATHANVMQGRGSASRRYHFNWNYEPTLPKRTNVYQVPDYSSSYKPPKIEPAGFNVMNLEYKVADIPTYKAPKYPAPEIKVHKQEYKPESGVIKHTISRYNPEVDDVYNGTTNRALPNNGGALWAPQKREDIIWYNQQQQPSAVTETSKSAPKSTNQPVNTGAVNFNVPNNTAINGVVNNAVNTSEYNSNTNYRIPAHNMPSYEKYDYEKHTYKRSVYNRASNKTRSNSSSGKSSNYKSPFTNMYYDVNDNSINYYNIYNYTPWDGKGKGYKKTAPKKSSAEKSKTPNTSKTTTKTTKSKTGGY